MHRTERGQVAGIEAVIFGMLVFVIGVLVVANAWGVVDAKMAAGAAAREASRTYVKATTEADALPSAIQAGENTLTALGRHATDTRVEPVPPISFTRCATATFRVVVHVPVLNLPWLGGIGPGFTVEARHSEIVDPYRSGLIGGGIKGSATCE